MTSETPTIYDKVRYPSAIFAQTSPDRLAVVARLNGLSTPDPETARVLEIGGGDCMNLLAMAAAFPRGSFTGFDIAPTVIERGRRRAEQAGLGNVRLEVVDILEADRLMPGPFDYIIAHGVLAWVPGPVREALLAYVGAALAPDGVAFISYNALPGGHFRMAVRDLMLHFVGHIEDPAERVSAAKDVLSQFSEPQAGDSAMMTAYRAQAKATLSQFDGHLYHDELGEVYAPQLHAEVCKAAARSGLAYLGDAGRDRLTDAFVPEATEPEPDLQAQIVRLAQERDFAELRYFRASLFVKEGTRPLRHLDHAAAADLWASTSNDRLPNGDFRSETGEVIGIRDTQLREAFTRLVEARPGRVRVTDLVHDPERVEAIVSLFDRGNVTLHASPAPFAALTPVAPRLSPLARENIKEGLPSVCSLDHRPVAIEDPSLRRFLAELDGSRSGAALEELGTASGFNDPSQWETAVEIALRCSLLMLDQGR